MPAQPRIETMDEAVEYVRQERERYEQFEFEVRPLYTAGRRFVVGLETATHKTVIVVGPRGGLDYWITADDVTAHALAGFLS